MNRFARLCVACFLLAGGMVVDANEPAVVRGLDVKQAEKREVRYSMIGPRDTLIFYTFNNQQAILQLTIGNKDESFPVSGRVLLFSKETSEEGLRKWINNQHSDGLYPEVPEPVHTGPIAAGVCEVTSYKQIGVTKGSGLRKVDYNDYEVMFSMKAQNVAGQFVLAAFTDSSKVLVEMK
ncbi:MAG: hypothetical protein P8P36_02110 [Akkermansiaceae bacterium]|nr:hypothetical protein [Akkermansiaceae bacterium]